MKTCAVYARKSIPASTFTRTPTRALLHSMLLNRYWIDEEYNAFGSHVVAGFARAVDWFDRNVVDGIVAANNSECAGVSKRHAFRGASQ